MDYKSSGVDIDAGNTLVERIKPYAAKAGRREVLAPLGGFGALFELDTQKYQHPVLVSATDGVGTKLKLAMALDQHDTIGIDLVAMCANDLVTLGAEPLFFLDYYATGALTVDIAADVIKGIAHGCELAGCALVGGETAEMPGMYSGQDYDLAGFCVGAVEKDHIIDGRHCQAGDQLIALASSGPHSNGYSLIRKVLEHHQIKLRDTFPDNGKSVGDMLLTPTRLYVQSILALLANTPINAIAHITGGGLIDNIPRVIPESLQAQLHQQSWEWPALFRWLQIKGNIATNEMARTFNCGVGMVLCVAAQHVQAALSQLRSTGEEAWVIGELTPRSDDQPQVVLQP